jgi:monofunctional biosynthetic peptidoglycan transglycosylase
VRALAKQKPGKTRLMLQREEEARAKGRHAPRAAPVFVPLAAVSRNLIFAVLASEDQKFFGHEGVDWRAIQESIETNVERGRFARGGSTITQQLAKNLYLGTAKTPTRKLRELVVTRWLEQDLSKARILELYLNVIEWGDSVYGCEAAARHWYGKPAAALSEVEAAGLAAMIPNPRRINPRVSPERHERATRRVLWLMAKAGYIARDVAGGGAEPPPPHEGALESEEDAEPPATPDSGTSPALQPAGMPSSPAPSPPAPSPPAPSSPAPSPPPAPSRPPPP